jgi:uncharacterized protein (UPF0264 family)
VTGLLVSVTNRHEAETALESGVDILDMKNPAAGALGRLPTETVAEIVALAKGLCTTSATLGDLPMQPELLAAAADEMVETGVDIIKIGFFGTECHEPCAAAVSRAVAGRARLVAVLMADQTPDLALVPALQKHGFYGVMLDTATKRGNHLLDYFDIDELQFFCNQTKRHGLISGLAGSLKNTHVEVLAHLNASYLGFRGAICLGENRNAELDSNKLLLIKNLLQKNNSGCAMPFMA